MPVITPADWGRFARSASLPAIEHMLSRARRDQQAAQRAVRRLEALAAERAAQVEAGEWPPKVERVTWRELRAGDVLVTLDGDLPVMEVNTEFRPDREQTVIFYEVGDGTVWHRSAPADEKASIRPRAEDTVAATAAGSPNES